MKAEFARYLISGGTATAVAYAVYSGLVFLGVSPYLSMTLAYVTGYWINFFVGRYWVFRLGRIVTSIRVEIAATAVVTVLGLGINLAIVAVLTNPPIAMNPYLGGAIAIAVVTLWNYGARKRWVYQ